MMGRRRRKRSTLGGLWESITEESTLTVLDPDGAPIPVLEAAMVSPDTIQIRWVEPPKPGEATWLHVHSVRMETPGQEPRTWPLSTEEDDWKIVHIHTLLSFNDAKAAAYWCRACGEGGTGRRQFQPRYETRLDGSELLLWTCETCGYAFQSELAGPADGYQGKLGPIEGHDTRD